MAINYFEKENELTKQLFDLDEIMSFQMEHDVQIIREPDYQYMCYIDSQGFGGGLTPMGALVVGIKQFKNKEKKESKSMVSDVGEQFTLVKEQLPEQDEDIIGVDKDGKKHYCFRSQWDEWRCSLTGYGLMVDIIKWQYKQK